MFENEILSSGEKIVRYREVLGLNQKDVVTKFTRNNLSAVENNRQNLSIEMAEDVVTNLNIKAKEKGIDITITVDFLMMSKDTQANRIFNTTVDKLKDISIIIEFKKMCNELNGFIDTYKISREAIFKYFNISADFFYCKNMYMDSIQVCSKAIKLSIYTINEFEEIRFSIKRAKAYIELKKIDDAINDLENSLILNKRINNIDFKIYLFFNLALCYKKKNQYEKSIRCLDELYTFGITDQELLLKIKLIYANSLNELDDFQEAEKKYIEILDDVSKKNNKVLIAMIFRNISELYYKRGETTKASYYIEESLKTYILPETLTFAGKIYKIFDFNIAEKYLLRALKNIKSSDEDKCIAINELLDIYIYYKDDSNILNLYSIFRNLRLSNNLSINLMYLKMLKYFTNSNKVKSLQIIDDLINLIKKNQEK